MTNVIVKKNYERTSWNDCVKLFDTKSVEPCGSSILTLVQDFHIDYRFTIKGEKFINVLIDHLGETNYLVEYAQKLEKQYLKTFPKSKNNMIMYELLLRQDIISHLENYLCLVLSTDAIDNDEKR